MLIDDKEERIDAQKIVGQDFGQWHVISFERREPSSGHLVYLVSCLNGHERFLRRGQLLKWTQHQCKKCEEPTQPNYSPSYLSFEEYIKKALVTESTPSNNTPIDFPLLWVLLRQSVVISQILDQYKRRLIYGKEMDMEKVAQLTKKMRELSNGAVMTEGYKPATKINVDLKIIHAILGMVTEVGELSETLLEKFYDDYHTGDGRFTDKQRLNLQEEAGDLSWYLALLYNSTGMDQQKILKGNVAKLEARYKGTFSADKAINRNVNEEMAVLRGAIE